MEERLQKILASAGFGSRRQCEELLIQGRVEVNGATAALGTKANPDTDEIKVDGERLKHSKKIYLAIFKPKGFLCTDRDQQGRQRTIDLIPEKFGRLFLIGRLDKDSEGLILATNDGEFSQKLTHPKYGVPKVYRVQVAGEVALETVKKLKDGVFLSDGFAKAADCVIKGQHKQSTILDLTLTEGMNREVRRLLAKLGHKVQTLFRIAVGPVRLGKLAPGEWRFLSKEEINAVRKSPLSFSIKKCNNQKRNNRSKEYRSKEFSNSPKEINRNSSPKRRNKKTVQRQHRTK